jgi:hypothetical protein
MTRNLFVKIKNASQNHTSTKNFKCDFQTGVGMATANNITILNDIRIGKLRSTYKILVGNPPMKRGDNLGDQSIDGL